MIIREERGWHTKAYVDKPSLVHTLSKCFSGTFKVVKNMAQAILCVERACLPMSGCA